MERGRINMGSAAKVAVAPTAPQAPPPPVASWSAAGAHHLGQSQVIRARGATADDAPGRPGGNAPAGSSLSRWCSSATTTLAPLSASRNVVAAGANAVNSGMCTAPLREKITGGPPRIRHADRVEQPAPHQDPAIPARSSTTTLVRPHPLTKSDAERQLDGGEGSGMNWRTLPAAVRGRSGAWRMPTTGSGRPRRDSPAAISLLMRPVSIGPLATTVIFAPVCVWLTW